MTLSQRKTPIQTCWPFLFLCAALLAGCAGTAGDPARGEELYRSNTIGDSAAPGCTSCHSLEPGDVLVGPSHANVAEKAEQRVQSPEYEGEATDAAGYLRESILEPNADIAPGFAPGIMYGRYAEVLTEEQIEDLVAFLLTLRDQ